MIVENGIVKGAGTAAHRKGGNMEITKKYKEDLAKALRCAKTGKAHHWATVAEILMVEIERQTSKAVVPMNDLLCCAAWHEEQADIYRDTYKKLGGDECTTIGCGIVKDKLERHAKWAKEIEFMAKET